MSPNLFAMRHIVSRVAISLALYVVWLPNVSATKLISLQDDPGIKLFAPFLPNKFFNFGNASTTFSINVDESVNRIQCLWCDNQSTSGGTVTYLAGPQLRIGDDWMLNSSHRLSDTYFPTRMVVDRLYEGDGTGRFSVKDNDRWSREVIESSIWKTLFAELNTTLSDGSSPLISSFQKPLASEESRFMLSKSGLNGQFEDWGFSLSLLHTSGWVPVQSHGPGDIRFVEVNSPVTGASRYAATLLPSGNPANQIIQLEPMSMSLVRVDLRHRAWEPLKSGSVPYPLSIYFDVKEVVRYGKVDDKSIVRAVYHPHAPKQKRRFSR